MKLASIDIGSNAVRLLLAQVLNSDKPYFSKDSLIRIPIRLGEDSFTQGVISEEKKEKLVKTMIGFKYLIEAYKPLDFMACATSAFREASNAQEIINEVAEKTGIQIVIFNGKKEAETICACHIENYLAESDASYLYIDVGGGSTEMTLFFKNTSIISESFNIGTVRIINDCVTPEAWKLMKKWVKENIRKYKPLEAIGSGGNINKLLRYSGKKEQMFLIKKEIKTIYEYLNSFSYDERVRILNLHTDRADVIIPATTIFLKIMKWSKIKKINIPQFGLSDGILRILYEKHNIKQEF